MHGTGFELVEMLLSNPPLPLTLTLTLRLPLPLAPTLTRPTCFSAASLPRATAAFSNRSSRATGSKQCKRAAPPPCSVVYSRQSAPRCWRRILSVVLGRGSSLADPPTPTPARPALTQTNRNPDPHPNPNQVLAAVQLARKLQPAGRDLPKLAAAMDENWREIYDLADQIAERHLRTGPRSSFLEGAPVERLLPAATYFDADWKGKLESA
jgi:hypothetical protein